MNDFVAFITNHWVLSSLFALTLVALIVYELFQSQSSVFISAEQMVQLINHEDATIIDIRSDTSFESGHIINAHHIPASSFDKKLGSLQKFIQKPVVVVCANGQGAQKIASELQKNGFKAFALHNGIQAWKEANLPLVKK